MSNSSDKLIKIISSNIKHDLKNPINAILGYSELLLDLLDIDFPTIEDDIRSVHESGNIILSNINNLFSKESLDNSSILDIIKNYNFQHSFRTPLTTIIGLAEFLIEDKLYNNSHNQPDIEDSLDKIAKAGKELLKLINNLKGFSEYTLDELMDHYKKKIDIKKTTLSSFEFNSNKIKQSQRGTILIIDDEITNIELLKKILEQDNHKVLSALDASKASKILSDNSISIDLILLDLIMPKINGMELLQKLKADSKTYHIPIIMLSALDEIETIIECINLGADDFLMKPINRVFLKARLNNALEKKYFRDKEHRYQEKIKVEQEKSDNLLLNILPSITAERLKAGETLIADDIDSATVLFADISEFTSLSATISAKNLVMLLNNVFSAFDDLLVKHSLEKIKTIGDSYMLAGGIPTPRTDHAKLVASMAIDMLDIMPKINKDTNQSLEIRIGINSGPLSAGVIGKKKFIYDLWGDTVNVASRMETSGESSRIHVSEATFQYLKDIYEFEKCEKQDIPGKGLMQTYFLTSRL